MVTIFRLGGILYLVYTRDHRPPHVHVKPSPVRPEWELRIYLGRREDGSEDEYGRSLGDSDILSGKLKASKIEAYVEILVANLDKAWEVWDSIYGGDA